MRRRRVGLAPQHLLSCSLYTVNYCVHTFFKNMECGCPRLRRGSSLMCRTSHGVLSSQRCRAAAVSNKKIPDCVRVQGWRRTAPRIRPLPAADTNRLAYAPPIDWYSHSQCGLCVPDYIRYYLVSSLRMSSVTYQDIHRSTSSLVIPSMNMASM